MISLVFSVPGARFASDAVAKGRNVGLATIILGVREVVQVGDLRLACVVLAVRKVVEIGDLGFAGVVL